jgi:DNA repair protein RecO (recombination protein O)
VLKQSRGIVLSYVKYSESSIISKIYTKEFGLQSYVVKGVRSKKSKTRIALFEPLSIVEIIAYQNENKSIHNLKEIRIDYPYQSIPFDTVKRSIMFFLDEILIKTIKEESSNPALFDWLVHSLEWFDLSEENKLNFHLSFMMQLSRFLGFYPKKDKVRDYRFFDLDSGLFTGQNPKSANHLIGEQAVLFHDIYQKSFDDASKIKISLSQRRKLLESLIIYYKIHSPGFGELKSLDVLKAIMS